MINRIPSCLFIGVYLRQLPCMSRFSETCMCLDPIQYLILFIIIKVREIITSMFKDMTTIQISKVVVCYLQYQVWFFICVVQALEVIGPVHRHMITGTVTINGAYIKPPLRHTECLGAVPKTKRWTLDRILFILGRRRGYQPPGWSGP